MKTLNKKVIRDVAITTLLVAGIGTGFYINDKRGMLEQKLAVEEVIDPPFDTINRWYGKSGLWGILVIGNVNDLDHVTKESYRKQYEGMIDKYNRLSREYSVNHPNYKPRNFIPSEEIFGK